MVLSENNLKYLHEYLLTFEGSADGRDSPDEILKKVKSIELDRNYDHEFYNKRWKGIDDQEDLLNQVISKILGYWKYWDRIE